MAIGGQIYNLLFKRTSTYVLTLCVGIFVFERSADGIADKIFDTINSGKQWKDIKHLYEKKEEA
jgi:ubiquinol-cytochrome c reductase subunit 9